VKAVKDDIVIIGKEQETYYYDEKTKLWNCCTREVYGSFIPDFYEQSGKNLMSAFKKYTDEDDADNGMLDGLAAMQKFVKIAVRQSPFHVGCLKVRDCVGWFEVVPRQMHREQHLPESR
jgi:hypothetical protein